MKTNIIFSVANSFIIFLWFVLSSGPIYAQEHTSGEAPQLRCKRTYFLFLRRSRLSKRWNTPCRVRHGVFFASLPHILLSYRTPIETFNLFRQELCHTSLSSLPGVKPACVLRLAWRNSCSNRFSIFLGEFSVTSAAGPGIRRRRSRGSHRRWGRGKAYRCRSRCSSHRRGPS